MIGASSKVIKSSNSTHCKLSHSVPLQSEHPSLVSRIKGPAVGRGRTKAPSTSPSKPAVAANIPDGPADANMPVNKSRLAFQHKFFGTALPPNPMQCNTLCTTLFYALGPVSHKWSNLPILWCHIPSRCHFRRLGVGNGCFGHPSCPTPLSMMTWPKTFVHLATLQDRWCLNLALHLLLHKHNHKVKAPKSSLRSLKKHLRRL